MFLSIHLFLSIYSSIYSLIPLSIHALVHLSTDLPIHLYTDISIHSIIKLCINQLSIYSICLLIHPPIHLSFIQSRQTCFGFIIMNRDKTVKKMKTRRTWPLLLDGIDRLRDLNFGGSGQSMASIPRGGDSCLQFRPAVPAAGEYYLEPTASAFWRRRRRESCTLRCRGAQSIREGPFGVGGDAYGLRSSDPASDPFWTFGRERER